MIGDPFRIIRANLSDIADWAALRAGLWPDQPAAAHAEELEVLLAEDDDRLFGFLARAADGRAAGFAEVSIRRDHVNGCGSAPVLFLEGIYVLPAFRRRGMATALITAVKALGHQRGIADFASDALLENTESHVFHRALGFDETERVVFFLQKL